MLDVLKETSRDSPLSLQNPLTCTNVGTYKLFHKLQGSHVEVLLDAQGNGGDLQSWVSYFMLTKTRVVEIGALKDLNGSEKGFQK